MDFIEDLFDDVLDFDKKKKHRHYDEHHHKHHKHDDHDDDHHHHQDRPYGQEREYRDREYHDRDFQRRDYPDQGYRQERPRDDFDHHTGSYKYPRRDPEPDYPPQARRGDIASYCVQCRNPLLANDRFCSKCGTQVVRETRCRNCTALIEPGARFCTSCGAPA